MEFQKEYLTHLFYRIFKARGSGFIPEAKDIRDFSMGIFGFGNYVPKFQSKIIPTISDKDQGQFNDCVFNATTVSKEIDEGCELSVRGIVSYARANNLLSGNGWSSISYGQKVLKDWGITSEKDIPSNTNTSWDDFSTFKIAPYTNQAKDHRTQSYWSTSGINDVLKLIDDGKAPVMAINWFTGFNQGGGFSAPWIISKAVGYSVGGHCVAIIGYNLNYYGQKVLIIKNSYGKNWGGKFTDQHGVTVSGCFAITFDYWTANNLGSMANLDIPVETGNFLNQYDGKNVKATASTIYFIQHGVKKAYLDWATYLAYGGMDAGYSVVKDELLVKIPSGDNMDIKLTPYWSWLKEADQMQILPTMLDLLHKQKLGLITIK